MSEKRYLVYPKKSENRIKISDIETTVRSDFEKAGVRSSFN